MVVLQHGLGGYPAGILSRFKAFAEQRGCLLFAPCGSRKLIRHEGNPSYDYLVARDAVRVLAKIDELRKSHSIGGEVYLAGFSKGGMMSLKIGLQHSARFAGIVVFSGVALSLPTRQQQTIPVYVFCGSLDPEKELILKTVTLLKKSGYPVHQELFEGGHRLPEKGALERALRWIERQ